MSDQLGVAWSSVVPAAWFVPLAVASVLFANVVALGPGPRARRTHPADALRTE